MAEVAVLFPFAGEAGDAEKDDGAPDTPLQALLEFHTPRHAAEGGQADRLRLECLLRQLEYQSALPAECGGRPVDTAWLRAELGLKPMEYKAPPG
jgi:hypothetical protein